MKKFLAFGYLVGCLFVNYSQAAELEPEPEQKSPRTQNSSRMIYVSSEAGYTLLIKEHPLSNQKDPYRRPCHRLSYILILDQENKQGRASGDFARSEASDTFETVQQTKNLKGIDWRVLRRVFSYQTAWSCTEKAWCTYYRIDKSDFKKANKLYLAFKDATKVGDFSDGCNMSLSLDFEILRINHVVEFTDKNFTAYVFDEHIDIPDLPCCCCSPSTLEWLWTCSPVSSYLFGCWWGKCCSTYR